MTIEISQWYKSKKGYLCRAEMLHQDGSVTVTSHYTGNKIMVPPEEAAFFTITEAPDTPPGTALKIIKNEQRDEYFEIYNKYKHIIPGSIYKLHATIKTSPKEETFKAEGKTRVRRVKSSAKGSTRCVIRCQTAGCKNTRDIKVQDAFQVQVCLECKLKQKKKNLNSFLSKKKKKKKKKCATKTTTKNTRT